MADISKLFVTQLYHGRIGDEAPGLIDELAESCRVIAIDDEAGQRWCRKNGYNGYTSYASLNDLPWRFPVFRKLQKALDRHVAVFVKALEFDAAGRKFTLDSLWINVMPEGGVHTSHLHPHSVISGTLYVAMPEGAASIKFEDPRHAMMMAAPAKKAKAAEENRSFVYRAPTPGDLLLWESWLRHEVPLNRAEGERISVSFNYRWGD